MISPEKPERIERVRAMEAILDQQQGLLDKLKQTLDEFETQQADFQRLKDYYGSQTYFEDMAEAGKGNLADVKCGVLSEDAVFDAIGDQFDLAVRLLELGTDIIKKH